ncbi:MAG: peptide chain release factor family protein [Lacipirellulaceae bacterium]
MHPAQLPLDELLGQCAVRRTRRGGPGGQHRNKVESAIEVTHAPTGVAAEASERRSQHENHAVAVQRLRVRLALAVRTQPPDEPTPLWRSRLRGGRIAVSVEHGDFPALLAEALDHVAAVGWDESVAAQGLGLSRTQLVKLLAQEPAALVLLNHHRAEKGLGPLR